MYDLIPHSQVYSRRTRSEASKRVAFGEMAEILVCERFGGLRLNTGGAKGSLCPDVRFPWGEVEVKSTHNGSVIVYNFRLKKELERRGERYIYLIVRHSGCRETFFHDSVVHFLTLGDVLKAVEGKRVKVPNADKPHGSNREGYKEGYRSFTLSQIKFTCTGHLTKSSNGILSL